MAEPTRAHRLVAADLAGMHTALTGEGFTHDEAITLLCQLIAHPAAVPRADRRGAVAKLLADATGQKPPATRSPVEDRAADLWNPPSPIPGAPAHE